MTNDPAATHVQPPRYLRTCLQGVVFLLFSARKSLLHLTLSSGLLTHNKPEVVESALKAVEKLVYSLPSDLEHVCLELTKVLLHLADNTAMDSFTLCRHKALLALAVCCPEKVLLV